MPKPYIYLDLDKRRRLRFRHNDIADMEVFSHMNFGELLQKQEFHGVRVLLSYGLRWEEKRGMTPQQAGDLIQDHWFSQGHTLDELAPYIEDALRVAGILRDGKKAELAIEDDEGNAQPDAAA